MRFYRSFLTTVPKDCQSSAVKAGNYEQSKDYAAGSGFSLDEY